jgi:hypothetical protein
VGDGRAVRVRGFPRDRGPLWELLCYAQIGGLAAATVIMLPLVPVFYSITVLDLKIVKWVPGTTEGCAGWTSNNAKPARIAADRQM